MLALCVLTIAIQIDGGHFGVFSKPLSDTYTSSPKIEALSKMKPQHVKANKNRWIRGYNPVIWTFETSKKTEEMTSKLLSQGFEKRAASTIFVRFEQDRIQTVLVFAGRWRCRKEHSVQSWDYFDVDKFTTVKVIETPYLAGPLPKVWPELAKQKRLFANIPATHIRTLDNAELVSMSIGETQGGCMQVWTTWRVQMKEMDFAKAVKSDAQLIKQWRRSPRDIIPLSMHSRLYPLDKTLNWVYIDRNYETDVPSKLRDSNTFVQGSFVAGRYPTQKQASFLN